MFDRLLPRRVDNVYSGYQLALWLFALVIFMRVAISVNSIFRGYVVASEADGLPLGTFPPAAAQTVVSLFALLGLSHLMICLLSIVVLIRYRGMVPLMFALLLLENLSRKVILRFFPIVRTGRPPGFYVDFALVGLMIVGLALSLWNRGALQVRN